MILGLNPLDFATLKKVGQVSITSVNIGARVYTAAQPQGVKNPEVVQIEALYANGRLLIRIAPNK